MGTIISAVTGALGGVWGYVASAAAGALAAGAAAVWLTHAVMAGEIASLKAADAQAETQAVAAQAAATAREFTVSQNAAVAEASAQQKIVVQHDVVKEEIVTHVPATAACIPYGVVRVLDAAAENDPAVAAGLAAGEPDDACAPVSWRDLASALVDDYGAAVANAEQLNALEASVRDIAAAQTSSMKGN